MMAGFVTSCTVTTPRLTTRVLFTGDHENDVPVLFLHGNGGTGSYWQEAMLGLPKGFCGIAPDQRGFGKADISAKIDATRGCADLADDAFALLNTLKIEKAHMVGHSATGIVVLYMLLDQPHRILSLNLAAPVSPYGAGCTKDINGTLCYADGAGTGGGGIPPVYMKALETRDKSDDPSSARSILFNLLMKAPVHHPRKEELLDELLEMHTGPQDYPGDSVPSLNWPYFAPGKYGLVNSLAPNYRRDLTPVWDLKYKPRVLWISGEYDVVVNDNAPLDIAVLAQTGVFPVGGYPGKEVYPANPTHSQIEHYWDQYKENGGEFTHVRMPTGHFPFVEKPAEFSALLNKNLQGL